MLAIPIRVQSGTQHVVIPERVSGSYIEKFHLTHNPKNRHFLLKGMLLFLMGEKVSLYALNQEIDDELWLEQKEKILRFLDKIELKGNIIVSSSNYNQILYEQHRKHGYVSYANQQCIDNKLFPLNENSRLNERYSPYVCDGLFNAFRLPPCVITPVYNDKKLSDIDITPIDSDLLFRSGNWGSNKDRVKQAIEACLQDESNFIKNSKLTYLAASKLISKLNKIFKKIPENHKQLQDLHDGFNQIHGHISAVSNPLNIIKKESNKYDPLQPISSYPPLIQKSVDVIQSLEPIFAYTAWRYLIMYQDLFGKDKSVLPTKCTRFGISSIDFKTKKSLLALLEWLNNPQKAVNETVNGNNKTEFQKSVFANKYGVSTQAPVLTKRYDGRFYLYIKSDHVTEKFIMQKVKRTNRGFLRVGKHGLASLLTDEPQQMPDTMWNSYYDDEVPV